MGIELGGEAMYLGEVELSGQFAPEKQLAQVAVVLWAKILDPERETAIA